MTGAEQNAIDEANQVSNSNAINAAIKSGDTATVEKLSPGMTLWNGAFVNKSSVPQFQAQGATVSNGNVVGPAIKGLNPPTVNGQTDTTYPQGGPSPTVPGSPNQPDTTQPNPATVVSKDNIGGAGLTTGGVGGVGGQNNSGGSGSTTSPYEAGFNSATNAGITSPKDAGNARGIVSSYTDLGNNNGNTQADVVMAANAAHQKYLDDYTAFQSSQAQNESLTQQYTDLTKSMGIDAINTQLINMQTIMNGTEQDIRDEVTKAGGFATNSQVLALTTARNKQMVMNYNNLLTTRDDMQKNLTTMMGLAEQDRAYASAQIDKQLNFDQQQSTYADKMLTNAQDSLNNSAKTMGWNTILQGALASGDPQAVQRINSTMGNGFDLQTAADKETKDKISSDLTTKLNQAKIQSDINKNNADIRKVNNDIHLAGNPSGTTPGTTGNPILDNNTKITSTGISYIDGSNLTGKALSDAQTAAASSGIPFLNKANADIMSNVESARSNLTNLTNSLTNLTSSNSLTRPFNTIKNLFEGATQFGSSAPNIESYTTYKSGLISAFKAISGPGASGARGAQLVTQLMDNIPSINDTKSIAAGKLDTLNSLLNSTENSLLPNNQTYNGVKLPQSSTPSGASYNGIKLPH